MPRLVWMIVLLTLLLGCESDEETCNNARVAAHDAWAAYMTDLEAAHAARSRTITEAMEAEREGIRRRYLECQAARARLRAQAQPAAPTPPADRVPPGVPRVSTGRPEIRGALAAEVIDRVVGRHINEVRFCYEQQFNRNPSLSGRVVVGFIISPSGTVQSASAARSTLNNSGVERCVAQAVRQWTFPAPDGGGVVGVNYPFVFGSSESAETGGDTAASVAEPSADSEAGEDDGLEETPAWLRNEEGECQSPAAAETNARILMRGRHPEPPSQASAQQVADRIMGRAIPLRDAVRDFRTRNAERLTHGPNADEALESVEAVWEACQSVEP